MTRKRHGEILGSLGAVEVLHPVESIRLEEAVYCVNCGMVTRMIDSRTVCAVCQYGTALFSLAKVLTRDGSKP
jgi:hypothetical protein